MYFSRVRIRSGLNELSELADMLRQDNYSVHRMLWRLFPGQEKRTFLYREEIAREQLGPSPAIRGEPVYYIVSETKPEDAESSIFSVESKQYNPQLEVGQRMQFECRVNPVVSRQDKKHDVTMDTQLQFLAALTKTLGLEKMMPEDADKRVFKKLLLEKGGASLSAKLAEILAGDLRYAERLEHITSVSGKLDWAIKSRIDQTLESWMHRQGERCGFEIITGGDGLSKLQNSSYSWHGLPQKAQKRGQKSGFSSIDFTGELQVNNVEKFRHTLFTGLGRAKAFGCGLLMVKKVNV